MAKHKVHTCVCAKAKNVAHREAKLALKEIMKETRVKCQAKKIAISLAEYDKEMAFYREEAKQREEMRKFIIMKEKEFLMGETF